MFGLSRECALTNAEKYANMQHKMHFSFKSPTEIHKELCASGVFTEEKQKDLAEKIGVDQGTISRIASGRFKRVNKSVLELCKYAKVEASRGYPLSDLRSLLDHQSDTSDPSKKKIINIIGLAVELLERP
ncbi:helix-turn-helix transcriptional regulator [Verrucomicrobium sp. GAS474]|uniref:helix-turn-helix domain-containing protein n=1 Tax=Verrucomicrobium sp. GAS474 TaxID=1882831 RepID=UPI0012FFC9A6|nr:helix-turn-helix transcriptional regulator [Verrucomicrobium sp. GAS474]